MELIRDAAGLREATEAARSSDGSVALVPTMGALHAGHRSLIGRAREVDPWLVVSIFVNPTQFEAPDAVAAYPRDEAADLALCRELGVDAVWAPPVEEVYPSGVDLLVPDPGPVGDTFEGASRPGHFRGVLTMVRRLFDLAGPCTAYFGEKDAQQLFLIRAMVDADRLPVTVVGVPTLREPDGLAASSRNALLAQAEREQAACLFLALAEAAGLARGGERDPAVLVAAMAREVGATPLARLDHAAVVDDRTFSPIERLGPGVPARALVAARFPSARLIDNLALPEPGPSGRLSARTDVGDDEPSFPLVD